MDKTPWLVRSGEVLLPRTFPRDPSPKDDGSSWFLSQGTPTMWYEGLRATPTHTLMLREPEDFEGTLTSIYPGGSGLIRVEVELACGCCLMSGHMDDANLTRLWAHGSRGRCPVVVRPTTRGWLQTNVLALVKVEEG